MSLGGRISDAITAFRNPVRPTWVVAEQTMLWRILYLATSKDDAVAWVAKDAPNQANERFVTVATQETVRGWNTDLIESSAFWRDLARLGRMIDQARTDAVLDKAGVIGETAALQILKLSDPGDSLSAPAQKGPTDD